MLVQPFGSTYQPLELKNDYEIVSKALAFVMDVKEALNSENSENVEKLKQAESLVVHQIAGPPYYKHEPEMPNSTVKKKKKNKKKIVIRCLN